MGAWDQRHPLECYVFTFLPRLLQLKDKITKPRYLYRAPVDCQNFCPSFLLLEVFLPLLLEVT